MNILVVGGGAREHALAWRLSHEAEVVVAPGNPGIADSCETAAVSPKDHAGLLELCRARAIDLVVVGPEDPLIEGLADALRAAQIPVHGPNADGAMLEGSKAFSKALMREAGVRTAAFQSFTEPDAASEYTRARYAEGKAVAVKASGNALGKGVAVCLSLDEALDAIRRMMVERQFGAAGETLVIEDLLSGREFSLLTIVGDQNYVSLPVAQDHKRVFDGDEGPNTGGMGAFSPVSAIGPELVTEVETKIVEPILGALRARGIGFRGTLFSGIMLDSGVPYCLEFNVRMGDPETQVVMMRIESGFAEALYAAATGGRIHPPTVVDLASVAVAVCAAGYPGTGSKGAPIEIGEIPLAAKLFHAGTALQNGRLVTNGGRIITATATGRTLGAAREAAYQAARSVRFEGARYRTDIGANA